jgi:hypothetical protein
MELSSVLDVVGTWLTEAYYEYALDDLSKVLRTISSSSLAKIYRGLAGEERVTFLAILPLELVTGLPILGDFQVSGLSVTPIEIEIGDTVEISYTLENVGTETDDYVIALRINDETYFTSEGILAGGASVFIEHSTSIDAEGSYEVGVLDLTTTFTVTEPVVEPPEPANLVAESIQLLPETVEAGESLSISVSVKNVGEEPGSDSFDLLIDSEFVETKEIYLLPDEDAVIVFNIIAEYEAGTHDVSVGGLSSSFEVTVTREIPWLTIITIVVILIVGGGYYYYTRYYQRGESLF